MHELAVGLVGVIVGGGITAGSNWALERNRVGREEAKEGQRHDQELVRAARLVHEELYEAALMIELAINHYRWWPHPSRELSRKRWDEFAPVLAGASQISTEDWSLLAFAYEALRDREAQLDVRYREAGKLPPFTTEDDTDLRFALTSVEEGRQVVEGLAGYCLNVTGPDAVAAMFNAAARAAAEILPGSGDAREWVRFRTRLEIKEAQEVTGVALMGAPRWERFTTTLPVGRILTAVVPDIPGSRAFAVSPLGDTGAGSEQARLFVPEHLRGHAHYEAFLLLLDATRCREWFEDLGPARPWAELESPLRDGASIG